MGVIEIRSAVLLAAGAALAPAAVGQCQAQKLTASDMAQGDEFGTSVAMSGSWSVIGAPMNDDIADQSGAAYVLKLQGGSWVEVQKLKASDVSFGTAFGLAVAIEGATILVGSPCDHQGRGSVYVFQLVGGNWVETQKLLTSDGDLDDQFGRRIAISESRAVVGAQQDEDAGGMYSGSAYVFENQGGVWMETAKLTASDAEFGDSFGRSVALFGDLALIGSAADVGNNKDAGVAYLFEFTPATGWQEIQKLMASDGADSDYFGLSVALSESIAICGAPSHDAAALYGGAVYVFEKRGSNWAEIQKILAGDADDYDQFGVSVALDGDMLLVGAHGDDDMGGGFSTQSGAAYLFRHDGSTWVQTAKILAEDGEAGDLLSLSLDLEGDRALISAHLDDDFCPGQITCNSGAAYVFHLAPTASQYCSCDAGAPCGNEDDHGGCLNSTGAGAILGACGAASVSADDLMLVSTHLPPQAFDVLFMGPTPGGPFPLGDGLRCVAGSLYRFPVTQADASGKVVHAGLVSQASLHLPPAAQITAGSTWYFQDWFRDPQGPCGTTYNVSNGVQVTFVP